MTQTEPDDPTEPRELEPDEEPIHKGPEGPRPIPEIDERARYAWCN